jgi:hypothetical protein
MVVLEEALQTLELSIAIREAEGDQDSARSSHGYAQSLRVEIGYAISDILPQLRIPELQHQLGEPHQCSKPSALVHGVLSPSQHCIRFWPNL